MTMHRTEQTATYTIEGPDEEGYYRVTYPHGGTTGWHSKVWLHNHTTRTVVDLALSKMGLLTQKIAEYEGGVNGLVDEDLAHFGPDVTKALSDAQRTQDHGNTWGAALKIYKEAMA